MIVRKLVRGFPGRPVRRGRGCVNGLMHTIMVWWQSFDTWGPVTKRGKGDGARQAGRMQPNETRI